MTASVMLCSVILRILVKPLSCVARGSAHARGEKERLTARDGAAWERGSSPSAAGPAPEPLPEEERGQDRQQPEPEQIPRAVVAEELVERPEDERADDRALDAADAADHHHEDRERRPVDAEGGVRADAQVTQEVERAGQSGAQRRDNVDGELHAAHVDALRLGRRLVVADSQQGQAALAAQEQVHAGDGHHGARKGQSVGGGFPVAFSIPRKAVRLVPDPPPTAETLATPSRKTSAITHVPMAK
jgi:hypothetical protein